MKARGERANVLPESGDQIIAARCTAGLERPRYTCAGRFAASASNEVLMPLACDLEETLTELFAIAATGLDSVAVGAEGDHLDRIVGTVLGQVMDVVDLKDWVS